VLAGCHAFIDTYDGHLEDFFIKRENDEDIYDKLCVDYTGVMIRINI
jgi:hypothetical protein